MADLYLAFDLGNFSSVVFASCGTAERKVLFHSCFLKEQPDFLNKMKKREEKRIQFASDLQECLVKDDPTFKATIVDKYLQSDELEDFPEMFINNLVLREIRHGEIQTDKDGKTELVFDEEFVFDEGDEGKSRYFFGETAFHWLNKNLPANDYSETIQKLKTLKDRERWQDHKEYNIDPQDGHFKEFQKCFDFLVQFLKTKVIPKQQEHMSVFPTQDLGYDQGQHRVYAIFAAPVGANKLTRILYYFLGRQSGIDGIVIRPEAELVAKSLDKEECMVFDIGAGTTDICVRTGTRLVEEFQASSPRAGNRIDQLVRFYIKKTVEEHASDFGKITDADLGTLARTRNWKEMVSSDHWEQVSLSKEYRNYFTVIYTDEESKDGFFDVRPYMPEIVKTAVRTIFLKSEDDDDIDQEVREILKGTGPTIPELVDRIFEVEDEQLRTELKGKQMDIIENVIVAGGGSRLFNIQEIIKQDVLVERLQSVDRVKVHVVENPLTALVEGAMDYNFDVLEPSWEEIAEIQKNWNAVELEKCQDLFEKLDPKKKEAIKAISTYEENSE